MMSRLATDKKDKQVVLLTDAVPMLQNLLQSYQKELFERAKNRRDAQWFSAESYEEIKINLEKKPGFYQSGWCASATCEATLKELKATIRCRLSENKHTICFSCKKPSEGDVLIAKSY